EPLGDRDGRIALYLADRQSQLLRPVGVRLKADTTTEKARNHQTADTTTDVRRVRLPPSREASALAEASAFAEASADRRSLGGGGQPDRGRPPDRGTAIIDYLHSHGASFFGPLHQAVGGGYPAETVGALWSLVWQGVVTNDTFHALRAFTRESAASKRPRRDGRPPSPSNSSRGTVC